MSELSARDSQAHATTASPRKLGALEPDLKFQALDTALKSIEERQDQMDGFSVNATRQSIEYLADQMPVVRQIRYVARDFFEAMDATHPKKSDIELVYQSIVARVTKCEERFRHIQSWLNSYDN